MKQTFTIILIASQLSLFAQGSMNLDSLFNWQDTLLPASTAHNNTYNEIWGYADSGNEYAIIGTTMGTHIFDVTDPATSSEVVFIEGALTGTSIVHRDFHDFQDHLYIVCDEGASTLQIADLSFLPDSAPVVYDSNALFARSHNIFIDSASARMYACGGSVLFAVYSLADPSSPTLLLDCPADVPFWSSIGYVHDVFVRGDTAYLNTEQRGLFIVDFSNIAAPQMIGSLDVYTQQGFNHSGWLMPDRPYYAFADETHGTDVKVVDVSDMSNIEVTDTIGSNVHPSSVPHNLIYRDELLFISFYFDGLYMFDCTDPAHPQLAGFYDTSTEQHQHGFYRGCWGVYPFLPSGNILASDMQTGLWVFGTGLSSGVGPIETEQSEMFAYPNPTTAFLHIDEALLGSDYKVIDNLGRRVGSGTVLSASINVSAMRPGIYTLLLTTENESRTTRFVKR